MDTTTQKAMFSSDSDEYGTPRSFFDKLNRMFNFTLDPCSTDDNHKVQKHYTKEDDGLSKSWAGETAFVNPPYSDVAAWVRKAAEESRKGDTTVVMLIPSRTDTKYWHDYIMREASCVYFVKGRLRFESNKKNTAPFPSAVVVFGNYGVDQVVSVMSKSKPMLPIER